MLSDLQRSSIYADYCSALEFRCPTDIKAKIIEKLLEQRPDRWAVIGVTPLALGVFRDNDFKNVSGMGIQRAHLYMQRIDLYRHLVCKKMRMADFWEFIQQNDKTVFSLKAENKKDFSQSYYPIKDYSGFLSANVGWRRHTANDIATLKNLFDNKPELVAR